MAEGEHLGVSSTLPPTPSMKTLKKQWLEVLSTYQYVLCFCFLGLFFSLAGFLLLFTSLWYLSVLYLVWLFLDWDTPQQGGRRYQWLRNWTAWKHLSDYFPLKLVKTAELPPDRNYVLGSHPHGIMAVGTICNFATEGTGLSQVFPGLRFSLAVLNCLLYLPGHREYCLSCGACSVNRQSLDYVLSQSQLGRAVVILVGGANEALYAVPGEHCLTLRNRKGFVRLALRHGASLVPVYSFGENDIFRVKAFAPDSWQHLLQVTIKKLLSFCPCIFWGPCSVNRQSLDYVLSQSQLGRAVVILVGGANEALYAVPGEHCLTLRNRKGFVRLALRHGASLVPVYSFGENDIFRVKAFAPDSWQHLLQVTSKKLLSFCPCIFWGRGLFSAKSWGLLPLARPITTVVGRPIPVPQCPQPTEEQVDHYHTLYMKALEQLFEEHKESCGLPASTRLTFI
ncbi:hypothetical protein JEQ12_012647 [Ovis aries]|uniref:Acyltransferase n=1 Tax=Ovis aries TaxID=9940 RepID=A0A835ZL45_SHEEP|nr:hypothetical protein JEQ12_012647 [Ovis aries]